MTSWDLTSATHAPLVKDRGKAQVQFSSTLVYYFQSGCFGHWSSDDRGDRVRNRGRWQRMAGVWIKECESQRYTEMFRSCGTTIQLSADEITRPGSLRCSFSDQRARSGVGVSLQVTAFRSSVVCGVNHGLSTSRLVCFARLLLRLSLDLYSVVILNQLLLLRTALGSGPWALPNCWNPATISTKSDVWDIDIRHRVWNSSQPSPNRATEPKKCEIGYLNNAASRS